MLFNVIVVLLVILGAIALVITANLLFYSAKARKIGTFVGICTALVVLMLLTGSCSTYTCPTYSKVYHKYKSLPGSHKLPPTARRAIR